MRHHHLWLATVSVFALALGSANAAPRNYDPVVVQGLGPEAEAMAAATQQPAYTLQAPYNQPAYAQPAYAPRRVQTASNLGGGLIEMLATGGQPQSAVIYNNPGYGRPAYAPRAQQATYSPQQAEPRRTVDPEYLRTEVDYQGSERPGTLVVDTPSRHLYLVQGNGRALRYGIGVGRPGFEWAGVKTVTRKTEWPDWTPPPEMIKRRPDLPRYMAGGPENPMGARALYLGSSLYRIHGTNEPHTIGQNVSSGCIRMMNDDVVDLYGRVGVGAKVIVQ